MTTQIVPSSGQGALVTQQGPGTTPGYSALDLRRANSGSLQAGVYGTPTLITAGGVANTANADFMVTQRGAGANMSVDVNMPGGGSAYVQGGTISGQGLYTVPVHSAVINEVIAPADPTNPRIDQVILEVLDNVLDASGGNNARTRVLTGTPTGGATVSNRLGAAVLPASALLLGDVVVAAGALSVANAVIRDRRKWARGAFVRQLATGGSASTTSGSPVVIGSNLLARIECSGVPMDIVLMAEAFNSTAGNGVGTGCFLDGSNIDGLSGLGGMTSSAANQGQEGGFVYTTNPVAGSHTIQPTFQITGGGSATLLAVFQNPAILVIRETIRQNTGNNIVTSG